MQKSTIKVSKNTLQMLHEFKKDLGCESLEDAILLSLNYSQMLEKMPNFEDLNLKVIFLDGEIKSNSQFILRLLRMNLELLKRVENLEKR